jgi:hypothetical protein
MRQITRRVTFALLVALALLLALGALPSYLQTGDPYYLTATPADGNHTAVDASLLTTDRYPYASAALADAAPNRSGQSDAYYRGPFGFKGAFTHSPFDEVDAVRARNASAVDADGVFVRQNGTLYRLAVTQEP